jgi:hypothetical protein
MATVEDTVYNFLANAGLPVIPGSVKVSDTGKVVTLPGDGKLKLVRQDWGWSVFDAGSGCYQGGGDTIEEALESYYG